MIKSLVLATALSSAPLAAQTSPASEAPLALELQTALHCSAMFAIVAADQSRGAKWALAYPPLQVRGKEYFVRVGAQLLDDTGVDRTQVQAQFQREAAMLRAEMARGDDPAVGFTATMPVCLDLLETTMPVVAGRTP